MRVVLAVFVAAVLVIAGVRWAAEQLRGPESYTGGRSAQETP